MFRRQQGPRGHAATRQRPGRSDAHGGAEPAEGLLAMRRIFPARLAEHPRFRSALLDAFAVMRNCGVRASLAAEFVVPG